MKKHYLVVLFLSVAISTWAQAPYKNLAPGSITTQDMWKVKADRLPALNSTQRDIYEMYVDYGTTAGDDHLYFSRYSSSYTNVDSSLNYAATVLNNLTGYQDPADPINTYIDWSLLGLTDSFPNNVAITIDTVYAGLIHSNNTGHLDTFALNLVKTLTSGAPNTTPAGVLKSIRDSVDFGYSVPPGGSYQDVSIPYVILGYGFEYTLVPGQKAAFAFYYYNKDKLDTAALLASSVDANADGIADVPSPYGTSYMRLPPFITAVTQNQNIIYVDAQGNNLGAYALQNWDFIFKITINTVVGIADNFDNLKVTTVAPNPAFDQAKVLYGLKQSSDVTINLYDLSGKLLRELYRGNDGAGSYIRNIDVSDMNSGTYMVSVQAGNGTPVVSKLVVGR